MVPLHTKERLIKKAIEKSGKNIAPCRVLRARGVKTLLENENYTYGLGKAGQQDIVLWYDTPDKSSHLVFVLGTVEEEAVSA